MGGRGKQVSSILMNQRRRDAQVSKIVEEWYEEGRHDRCKRWVYRHKVFPVFAISERSFFRSLERHKKRENKEKK
ncbi:hypothetical protein [Porphyromonas levii]|uniref:hypothetical protein n=1 Tax=Porphyromonas levii TaxID=28114 RepID=UPI00036D2368|nr:hypothetical protein [Porphyromonas levii]